MTELFDTTTLSARGQVVIPLTVRESLALKEGDKFIVLGDKDTVILKRITPPAWDDIVADIRAKVKEAKIVPKDVEKAIADSRRKHGH